MLSNLSGSAWDFLSVSTRDLHPGNIFNPEQTKMVSYSMLHPHACCSYHCSIHQGEIFKKVQLFGFKQKYRGEEGYVENYPFGSPSEIGLEEEEEVRDLQVLLCSLCALPKGVLAKARLNASSAARNFQECPIAFSCCPVFSHPSVFQIIKQQ